MEVPQYEIFISPLPTSAQVSSQSLQLANTWYGIIQIRLILESGEGGIKIYDT